MFFECLRNIIILIFLLLKIIQIIQIIQNIQKKSCKFIFLICKKNRKMFHFEYFE